ncbi:MAG: type II toxin-antitoxin system prevent-host-death family antitoxin [Actinomycetia bacterium]|nr:type II toxin-antitoxin system prevent-host-death family antitoxin [Actinomycetes bacterium]
MAGETHVGIRELRSDLAAHVRRAGAGDPVVVTVDGKPIARLVPLGDGGDPSLDDLIAAGLLEPPRRSETPPPPQPNDPVAGMRIDDVLHDLRGR